MKNRLSLLFLLFLISSCSTQTVEWISTTPEKQWVKNNITATTATNADAEIFPQKELQAIDGFGTCFNELGWTSLNELSDSDREAIMKELFSPGVGANFTICRMPVGANDFSLNWYSYDETDGDFGMKDFSLKNDTKTLIPYIKDALQYNPELKIWASPWSPPAWMKYNKHYAARSSAAMAEMIKKAALEQKEKGTDTNMLEQFKTMLNPKYQNDLALDKQGKEGEDMFIQKDKYLAAYALYFSKFIEGYRRDGINIFAVMPQNEFNSAQVFPSCCWKAGSLANFIGSYLGPAMNKLGVDIYFGTVERANEALVDTVLTDSLASKYVKGVGFQWAGKGALPGIHKRYPDLKYFQTEQECGNGKNDWKGAMHSWDLMKFYLNNGVSVYDYWNTSLLKGGISRWGWAQNSLVVVDAEKKDYRYSYEYYVMKHVSHFVLSGAKKLTTSGYDDLLAFRNTDGSIIVVVANQKDSPQKVGIKIGHLEIAPVLAAHSLNTFKLTD